MLTDVHDGSNTLFNADDASSAGQPFDEPARPLSDGRHSDSPSRHLRRAAAASCTSAAPSSTAQRLFSFPAASNRSTASADSKSSECHLPLSSPVSGCTPAACTTISHPNSVQGTEPRGTNVEGGESHSGGMGMMTIEARGSCVALGNHRRDGKQSALRQYLEFASPATSSCRLEGDPASAAGPSDSRSADADGDEHDRRDQQQQQQQDPPTERKEDETGTIHLRINDMLMSHRRDLAAYATSARWNEMPRLAYAAEVAIALEQHLLAPPISRSFDNATVIPLWTEERSLPSMNTLPPLSPWLLPEHQGALRQNSTSVCWLRSLPSLGTRERFIYTNEDVEFLQSRLGPWKEWAVATLQSSMPFSASHVAGHLIQAVGVLHQLGVDPAVAADEMIAVALCTIELPKQEGWSPALPLVHGDNRSIYAVMNHVCRVSRQDTAPGVSPPRLWAPGERTALNAALRLFAPIMIRVDTLLSRLPSTRRVIFRGVRNISATSGEYDPGRLVAWYQPSSASENWDVARRIGGTIFTIHAHSTAAVDFLSASPTECELMLPSYTVLRAMGATSPTLLRMLEVQCNLVTLRELGDEPLVDDVPAGLVESQRPLARRLFGRFMGLYVEGTLSRQRPPVAPWQESDKLFAVLNRFVEAPTQPPPLLLLGEGGTGKTSAMLAAYCHLVQHKEGSTPVVPVFIPLPQLSDVHDSDALDRRVYEHLGVNLRSEADAVSRRVTIVLLLDSLDECSILPDHRDRALIDPASFCATRCRVVVSCRSESEHCTAGGVVAGQRTSAWHVLPFAKADACDYVRRYAAVNCCCPTTLTDAMERTYDPLGTLRELPVTLSLMLHVAVHVDAIWNKSDEGRGCLPAAHVERGGGGSPRDDVDGCGEEVDASDPIVVESAKHAIYRSYIWLRCGGSGCIYARRVLSILQRVALFMVGRNRWQLPCQQVLREVEGSEPCATVFLARLENGDLPCRVESLEPSAQFSFSHKSIAEYLAAAALWKHPHLLSRIPSAFSCNQLGVVRWFGDISSGHPRQRATACSVFLDLLLSSVTPAVVASNAMALIACSGYPLDGAKIVNRRIEQCNLRHANLSGCDFTGTTFDRCELHDVDFSFACVEGTTFRQCGFGLLRELRGTGDTVTAVCVTPDGSHIVSGSEDKAVRVWEFTTGREVLKLTGHTGWVTSVCVTPSGQQIVSGSVDRSVRIWDVASGSEVQRLLGHTDRVTAVCVTRDGRRVVSGSYDQSVRMWDRETGREIVLIVAPTLGAVMALSLTPDGHHLVSGSRDKIVRIWSLPATESEALSQQLRVIEGHTSVVTAVTVTPDGRHIVSGSQDHTVRMWDALTSGEVRKLTGHTSVVTAVAVTPDGAHIVSGSLDQTVRMWSIATGREVRKLEGHTDRVTAVTMSPDGRVVLSGSGDRTVRLWDVTTGRDVRNMEGHTNRVMAICVSPDDRHVVSGSQDGTVRLWNVATGREVRKLEGHVDWVTCVCVTPDARHVVSGSVDRRVLVWEIETGRELRKLEGHADRVTSVCVTPDGKRTLSGSYDRCVRIWESQTGRHVGTLEGHTGWVTAVCSTPDSRYAISGSGDKTVCLWDLATQEVVRVFQWPTGPVASVCVTNDSRFILAASDRSIWVWDVTNGREVRMLEGHTNVVAAVCLTPDGRHVISGSRDKTVRIWEVATGHPVCSLEGHTDWVAAVCTTGSGTHVVSGSHDETVRMWDVFHPGGDGGENLRLVGVNDPVAGTVLTPPYHVACRTFGVRGGFRTFGARGRLDPTSDDAARTMFLLVSLSGPTADAS